MTALAGLGGYPGLRRSAPSSPSSLDLQRTARRFAANDPIRDILPFEEQAIRRSLVRRGEAALARRVIAAGLAEVAPPLGAALLLYDARELLLPGQPGSRDILVPADYSMTFSGWTHTHRNSFYQATAAANGWSVPSADHAFYLHLLSASAGTVATCVPPPTGYNHDYEWVEANSIRYVPLDDVPSETYANGHAVYRFEHYDLRPVAPPGTTGDTHGDEWVDRWVRPASAPNPVFDNPAPSTEPTMVTVEAPLPWPLSLPRAVNRSLSPNEQTQFGPGRVSDPLPWEPEAVPQPLPGPRPVPAPVVLVDPGLDLGGRPGPATGPLIVPPSPPAPPGPEEKHEKARLRGARGVYAVRAIAEQATEYIDSLNAFWYAVPPEFRTGYKLVRRKDGTTFWKKVFTASIAQKTRDVWVHADKLNLTAVFQNTVREIVTDMAVARVHQLGNRNNIGGVGLTAGPWDTYVSNLTRHLNSGTSRPPNSFGA